MRKERVTQTDDNTFEMTIKEPAERNLANKRIKEILAEEFGVPSKSVRIVTGHHSQGKIFDVTV